MIYKTESEAEEALTISRLEYTCDLPFCPLINDLCNTACICFSKGYIYEDQYSSTLTSPQKWQIYPPGCTSPQITGEINGGT